MSIMDKFKEFFSASGLPESYALHHAPGPAGEVLAALRGVIDPEMGIDIVSIGMVREISVEDNRATVVITTTTPGCPLADWLVAACAQAVTEMGLVPDVQVTHEPPWSPSDMER